MIYSACETLWPACLSVSLILCIMLNHWRSKARQRNTVSLAIDTATLSHFCDLFHVNVCISSSFLMCRVQTVNLSHSRPRYFLAIARYHDTLMKILKCRQRNNTKGFRSFLCMFVHMWSFPSLARCLCTNCKCWSARLAGVYGKQTLKCDQLSLYSMYVYM